MNTKLIRLLWVCLLVMAAPGVWAQNQVDMVPDQCVSGTMLVYPDGVMHCGVENESVYPIINTVHHILNCSD